MKKVKHIFNGRHFKQGSYSLTICIIVIAIVVIVNLLARKLLLGVSQVDMSKSGIYTIGEVSREVIDQLDRDVLVHIIAEEKNIDERILNFVDKYAAMSDHLSYDIVDPVLHPSVLKQYGVSENTVVVECPSTDKQTDFAFSEIIQYDQMSYYYGQYQETAFDGEGLLTSAVDYVTSENTKKLYFLEGHGESSLGTKISELIKKQNMTTASLNLLTEGKIPGDCDLLMIYGAVKDLAEDETVLLNDYMDQGGRIFVVIGDTDDELKNLRGFLKTYGIEQVNGYAADTERFYQQNMFNIFPVLSTESDITGELSADDLVLVSYSRALQLTDAAEDSITVSSFMTTSDKGCVVEADGETPGNYVLGAFAEKSLLGGKTGSLTVIAASSIVEDSLVQTFPSLANTTVFMNAITGNFDDVSTISIDAKSLEITYNTVSSAGMLGILFAGIIPLAILIAGFAHWMSRRKA